MWGHRFSNTGSLDTSGPLNSVQPKRSNPLPGTSVAPAPQPGSNTPTIYSYCRDLQASLQGARVGLLIGQTVVSSNPKP